MTESVANDVHLHLQDSDGTYAVATYLFPVHTLRVKPSYGTDGLRVVDKIKCLNVALDGLTILLLLITFHVALL